MRRLAALAVLVAAALSAHAAVDPDLKPVRVSGLGLGSLPDALKPRLGDLDLAIQMLRLEISDIDELLETNPDDATLLAKRSFLQTCLTPYEANSNQNDVATVRSRLSSIRSALATGAGLDGSDIVSVPVLYPLLNVPATHPREADRIFPNPVNLVVLKKAGGECRILVPHAGIVRILESFSNQFESLGYSFGDIWIIDTTGPHMWFGEAHCGSNAFRRK